MNAMETHAAAPVRSAAWSRGLRILGAVSRTAVAVALLLAAQSHVANGYQFLDTVLAYRLLPAPVAVGVAAVLPALQLALGAALLFAPTLRRAACWASVLLFLAFLAAQTSAYARELDIGCGCFGESAERIGWRSLATAGAGVVLSIVGLAGTRPPE